jgi:hypothetical protein
MRGLVTLLLATLGASSPDAEPYRGAGETTPRVRLLVPAYFYPAGEGLKAWDLLIASSARVPIVAIINPASGPGKRIDENYRIVFERAQPSKITLIGYVPLGYAKRPISTVKEEVDRWVSFYPEIRGIFFDEQPSQAEHARYASECFAYARQKIAKAVVVSNPGVACAREYLDGTDGPTVCLFEHETGFEAFQPPDWTTQFAPGRFAILLYHVPSAEAMRKALREAVRKRAGYVYITNDQGRNPWDRLPSYLEDEIKAVGEENEK